jgi:hypothetical protein
VAVALVIVVPSEELFSGQTANNVVIVVPTIFFGPNRRQRCDSHIFVIYQEVVVALVIVVPSEELFSGRITNNAVISIFGCTWLRL